MSRRWSVTIVSLLVLLLVVWALAYWYIGADAKFLWGLIKSGFEKPRPVVVVNANLNTNAPVTNTNVARSRFVGFKQSAIASGLIKPTRIAFEPGTNDLIVGELEGKIWRVHSDGKKQAVASGFNQLLGISFENQLEFLTPEEAARYDVSASHGRLLVASRTTISELRRQSDGTYGSRRDIVTGLPAGRHQTDLALIGPDGRLYIATGSRSDQGEGGIDPHEAAILVADADGQNLRVFAKGLRNPFGMKFIGKQLYVTDNGQDVPANGVPDELNVVEDGQDHGWPTCWGVGKGNDCAGKHSPIAILQEHSSADGFDAYDADQFPSEYRGNIFIALWGANSRDPDIGKKVVRVIPVANGLWKVEDFVTGLGNPIDIKVDPRDGSLLILDFGRGEVIRVTAKYE